jgi:hypothetical protein
MRMQPLAEQVKSSTTPHRCRLTSVRGCRKELAGVYAQARNRQLDWQSAARAASVLQILTRMLEGSELEQRLAALEEALGMGPAAKAAAKVNGHAGRGLQ